MGTPKARWNAWVATVDGWLNGNRHAFYNGQRRGQDESAGPAGIAAPARESIAPRLLAGLMLASAVVMLTFVAATAIVHNFSSKTVTRLTHAKVEQIASAEYRKARAKCQQLSAGARDACIVEAHAAEERSRAVAAMSRNDYLKMLRAQTDAGIDAGDRDAIVVEPACNFVARGTGSLCEIQVKPDQLSMPGTNLIPATLKSPQYASYVRPARLATIQVRQEPAAAQRREAPAPARFAVAPQPDRAIELAWSSRQ
jgi:hypothetical protein